MLTEISSISENNRNPNGIKKNMTTYEKKVVILSIYGSKPLITSLTYFIYNNIMIPFPLILLPIYGVILIRQQSKYPKMVV